MATQATNKSIAAEAMRKQKASQIMESLYKIAMDENEAPQTRASAAKTYLAKVLPDLEAVELKAEIETEVTAIKIEVLESTAAPAAP